MPPSTSTSPESKASNSPVTEKRMQKSPSSDSQVSTYSQASSQAEEKLRRLPAHKYASLNSFDAFVSSRMFVIGDQGYTVKLVPVRRELLTTPASECFHPYKDIANGQISLDQFSPPHLGFFMKLQLAKRRGFYNGNAKLVWSALFDAFIPLIGFGSIPTHQSHPGALRALVGIEEILSGGETSSTSARGTTTDNFVMTGIPDYVILDEADDLRVACENKSPLSLFGKGQGMHYLLTATLSELTQGRSPSSKVGFFTINGEVTAAQVGIPLNNRIVIKYEDEPMDFYDAIPYIVELIKNTMAS